MRVYNHEMTIRRGEAFTIDKIIQNRDGSPYVLPKMLKPCFVVTVSSSLYPNETSIVYRNFIDASSMPMFEDTRPVNVLDFTYSDGVTKLYPNGWSDLSLGPPGGFINGKLVVYDTGESDVTGKPKVPGYDYDGPGLDENPDAGWQATKICDQALFYYTRPDGTIEYKWWGPGWLDRELESDWLDYECRLTCLIPHEDTVKWREGDYYYSIDLIDNYDINTDVADVANVYPILGATKLSVLSNLRGGTTWK